MSIPQTQHINSHGDVPAHVPPELVVEYDFVHPGAPDEDLFDAIRRLHDAAAIFWTPCNGGHWVATRGDAICEILADHRRFSSRAAFIPPFNRPPVIPLEIDPPAHSAYRRMITPAFRPNRVRELADEARTLAVTLIEGFQPRGECEFVADFAQQLPIIVFLNMCNLPLADRPQLMQWTNASLRPVDAASRDAARAATSRYIGEWLERRRAHPGDDLLSYVLTAEVNGRRLTPEEAHSVATGLLGGGLDTVASSLGWAARFLAGSPAHRRQLIGQPELIPNAVQELLRRFSIANIARVVVHDMEYKGVQLKAGEQILLQACLHGLDADSFADPLAVDFCRADARRHSAFSHGVHRCPGANLAEQELGIFLEEWLRRIPDFCIKPGARVVTATGIVHGVLSLPLAWEVH